MNKDFQSPYEPKSVENKIYQSWEETGCFNPDVCIDKGIVNKDADNFSIILPPPNVTGVLHTGHALMLVIQDILVRRSRMMGKKTLWLPGTDHAAIATQSKVEKELSKQNIRKNDLGREEFLKRVGEFAKKSHDTIVDQVRKVGSSVDWSREAFTLDEKRSNAVYEAFSRMYKEGLIYRGERIVNWDPKGQTTISDDEVVYKEEKTKFYYLKYGPFTIGTSRPETKFGDKYVVMHPNDQRYAKHKHGDKIELEWINGKITTTVIKDESIDMEFGTGVMTITPSHSNIDFEIATRHDLDKEQVIDSYGKLLPIAGEFAGMKITEAREKILEKLKAKGLLVKEDEYTHNIAIAERSEGVIEPQIMKQWFVAVDKPFKIKNSQIKGIETGEMITLKELMIRVVKNGNINILPGRFEKVYFHWIENLHDWCISRQIWYGHRIPVWFLNKNTKEEELRVTKESPGNNWEQDPDTLDTWFSSGLWTFSTLGWPENTLDMETYHPTTIMETGYDILFFWVARMILMSGFLLEDIPFRTVYLHGLVRDEKGRKMSKSLGNIVDPLDLIEKYGADALRMSLIVGNPSGSDVNLSEEKVKAYKKFANKLWNIARFVFENNPDLLIDEGIAKEDKECKEFINQFQEIKKSIELDFKNLNLHLASEKIYHYVWHTFADIILEKSKQKLKIDREEVSTKNMLGFLLIEQLKILHPFMPFVTENIWSYLPNRKNMLFVEKWSQ